MNLRGWVLAGAFLAAGFSSASTNAPQSDDEDVVSADPLAMPKPMLTFLKSNDWGSHHLEWHTSRQWDLLQPSDQAWAKKQGWSRASIQEGATGNGLEFLAMHRVMIRTLTDKFPSDKALFDGWDAPPTNPDDPQDKVPSGAVKTFDLDKEKAIDKLANHLDDFDSDDDIGLYIETSLRPTSSDPSAR